MTLEELKAELRVILSEEDRPEADWSKVEALCLQIVKRLNTEPETPYPHDIVYRFLDDPDVRQKSAEYADAQRQRLRSWLASS
jgi:hypothetical protein